MGVVINPNSELGKELQKWEQFPMRTTDGEVLPAGNPYVFRPYPRMLYRAMPWRSTGKLMTSAPPVSPFGWTDPNLYQNALIEADAFNRSCQRIVPNESAHALAAGQGWCLSQAEALEQAEREHAAIGQAAAEELYKAQHSMGEKARAEFERAYEASDVHIADVAPPKRKPGRPAKAKPTTQEG